MGKVKSYDELVKLRDEVKKVTNLSGDGKTDAGIRIIIGMATCGIAAGASEALECIAEETKNLGLKDIKIVKAGCMGSCYAEPTVEVQISGEEPVLYANVTAERAKEIVTKHLKNGEIVKEYVIEKPYGNI